MLKSTGYADINLVKENFPSEERINQGKVAFIECYQDIPCNPCTTSCPHDAITITGEITNRPKLDIDKCIGCGICVYNCPGLAIMVIGKDKEDALHTFDIPYEMLPIPEKGDIVKGLNRKGEYICDVTVNRVINGKKQDRTALISVKVPSEYLYEFATIKVGE